MSENTPTLLTTVVPEGRERGTREVAGEVIVSEMSVSGGNSSLASGLSPRRQTATNDRKSPRRRAFNAAFGISHSVSLPLSTGGIRSIHVDHTERRYADIAASISDLDRQGLVRAVKVINVDIIKAI